MTFSHDQLAALHTQLYRHEALKLKPYRDSLGHLTIGVGHLLSKGISRRAAEVIFEDDLAEAVEVVMTWAPWAAAQLDPVRQRVLVDMAFNLGPKLAAFHRTLAAVKAGAYEEAAKDMLDSLWADQVGTRARTLAEMMRTGKDPFTP